MYKVSIFIDRREPGTKQWKRIETGLESARGMIAFEGNRDRAEEVFNNEVKLIREKEGCRLNTTMTEDIVEVYSVNIVEIWIDNKTGETRNNWLDQSPIYYFEK